MLAEIEAVADVRKSLRTRSEDRIASKDPFDKKKGYLSSAPVYAA